MLKRVGTIVLSFGLLLAFSSFDVERRSAAQGNWEKLGTKVVNFKVDRNVLVVGAHEGNFKKLKVAVSGGSLNMHRMVVHYGNGSKEEIELRHNFSKASASRVIDLRGHDRVIKKVVFVYDTKNAARQKAKVHVFGKH